MAGELTGIEPAVKPEPAETAAAVTGQRRYAVDWLRTLALALLIIYHVVVSFQPWGDIICLPQTEATIESWWIFMSMVNIWHIPILFMISGMGVRFARERRDWMQLLKDRTVRILVPYVFGIFVIGPIVTLASL